MDNLSAHKTKNVSLLFKLNLKLSNFQLIKWMQNNFYSIIFNVIREPDLNCIETIFNQIKKSFKSINNLKIENLIKNINLSLSIVSKESV